MTIQDYGGLRPTSVSYAEEPDQGIAPQNAQWHELADTVTAVEYENVAPEQIERMGLGDDVAELQSGVEAPSLTVTYDLSRWLYDNSGNPDDLLGYYVKRVAGNSVSSLTLRDEMKFGAVKPGSTVEYRTNGATNATSRETRIYAISNGIEIEEASLIGDVTAGVWTVEASLAAERVRTHQVDQPASGGETLAIKSTDAADTSLHVTLEADDGTTETLQLDGSDATTVVPGSASFTSLRGVAVYADNSGSPGDPTREHAGDIQVGVYDGVSAIDEVLCVLYGTDSYDGDEGDIGVIPVGSGAINSAPTDEFKPSDASVERPSGTPFELPGSVSVLELGFSQAIERAPGTGSRSQRIATGMLVPTATITYSTETGVEANSKEQQLGTANDMVIDFESDATYTVTLPDTRLTDASMSREAGTPNIENEAVFRAQDVPTVSNAP